MSGNKDTAIENLQKAEGKQTGPTTPEGKDASSRNALKHGGYAEEKIFGNCKGDECWSHKTGRCQLFASHKVDKGQLCLDHIENVKQVKIALDKTPIQAAKDIVSMQSALQDHTVKSAYAYITDEGLMVDELVAVDKNGTEHFKRKPHGALDYVRRATKDTAQILKDLTGFNVDPETGPGYLMEDVLRALQEEGTPE